MEKKEKVDQTIYNDLIIYNIPFRSLFKEKGRGGWRGSIANFSGLNEGGELKLTYRGFFSVASTGSIPNRSGRFRPRYWINTRAQCLVPRLLSSLLFRPPSTRSAGDKRWPALSLASLFREAWQKSEELLRLSSIYIYIYEILLIRLLLLFRDERIWNTRIWYILINSKSVSDILFEFVQTNNIFFLYFHCVFIIIARKIFFKGRIRNSIIPS